MDFADRQCGHQRLHSKRGPCTLRYDENASGYPRHRSRSSCLSHSPNAGDTQNNSNNGRLLDHFRERAGDTVQAHPARFSFSVLYRIDCVLLDAVLSGGLHRCSFQQDMVDLPLADWPFFGRSCLLQVGRTFYYRYHRPVRYPATLDALGQPKSVPANLGETCCGSSVVPYSHPYSILYVHVPDPLLDLE